MLLSDDNFSVYIRNLMRAIENCTKIYQTTKNIHYFSVYKCTDAAIKL
ncbi:hypothetical protein [Wolbachia endosymbiont of Phyllotreta cruciferae]|nr:hypothetical protein [Wolbachia endosymbiont of Phyllotreta cruciferae]